jgi:ABC-type glycerol-3-phosphate transport system permease component
MELTVDKVQKPSKSLKHHKNPSTLEKIKAINYIALIIDFAAIIVFATVFLLMFNAIKIPLTTNEMEQPELVLEQYYRVAGFIYSSQTINYIVSIMVIFLVVGISAFIVNFKRIRSLDLYDYHRWEAGNRYVHAFMSLLTLNIASFVVKLFAADLLMRYAEGMNTFEWLKLTFNQKKEKIKRDRDRKHDHVPTEEELIIRRRVRVQTLVKVLRYTFTYLFLLLVAIFIIIPFYWMILTSLKTYTESKANDPSFWVSFKEAQWVNLKFVFKNLNFGLYIRNTLLVSVLSTAGTLITTIFAAFAFSRINFKGREALFSLLLMTMMIPGEIYMITNFLTVSQVGFGWVGRDYPPAGFYAAMIVPFMTSVYYIFFLRQTFRQIPDTLYRAAKIDGCSDMKFLRRIMIPIAAPTIITITILSLLGTWNAYIWPKLITNPGLYGQDAKNYWLISVALRETSFIIETGSDPLPMYNLQIAASTIVTVPLLIVFLVLKKYIIRGVGTAGTKG